MSAEKRVMDNFVIHSHKKMKAAGSSECEKMTDLCANWIAKHYRPIQIVEDKGFIELVEFVNHLENVVELPRRTNVTEHICKKAAKGRIELKQRTKWEALFYCTTTDIWSLRALSAFIGFTIHYLTKEFELVSWNLEVQKFDGKHSGERICEVLQKLINDWNLIKANMVLMGRDNASNGALATRLLDVESFGCIAHSLHLILVLLFFPKRKRRAAIESCDNDTVNAGVMEDFEASLSCDEDVLIETVAEKVEVLRDLANYFCKSTKGVEKLKLLQSIKPLGCILDVVIRWNSSCYMLERLLLLQPAIQSFLAYCKSPGGKLEFKDFKKKAPKPEDRFIFEALQTLLKPLKVATTLLSNKKYCTLALLFPMLRLIKKNVGMMNIFDEVEQKYADAGIDMDENLGFMKKAQSYLLNNFCKQFQGLPVYVGAASILHPGLSGMNFLKEQEKKDAQEFIFSEMTNFAPINHSTVSDDPIEIEHVQVASPSIDSTHESKMIQELLLCENPNDEETTSLDEAEDVAALKLQCINEFKMYLEVEKLYVKDKSKDKCPYKWWKHHQSSFKLLAPVARKWLGYLASSVPCERAFSSSGNTITHKRASSSDELVRDLVLLHDNSQD